jgi:enterochelin esterase family protein
VLVVFDGPAYRSLVPVPVILDNLIAERRIPPIMAVLVSNPPGQRGPELHCSARFADFLATELLPWLATRYGVPLDPARTAVAGSSAGGLAATCAAYHHPERFGLVLSQSGAFWWRPEGPDQAPEWITRQLAARDRLPIRFYLDAGRLETASAGGQRSMLELTRHLVQVLDAKGYDVQAAEPDGGHEHLSWRATFADGVLALFGTETR